LDPSLYDEMERILANWKKASRDRGEISTVLQRMYEACLTLQELRNTLPDCLVYLDDDLKRIDCNKPEGWNIRHNPLILRRYNQCLSKIEMYVALRLIF